MVTPLSQTVIAPPSNVYTSDRFKEEILIHKPIILKSSGTTTISVTQQEADKWYGDFHVLLLEKGQQYHHLWLLTILNNLTDSSAYNSDFLDIIIPDAKLIEKIMDIFNTTHQ